MMTFEGKKLVTEINKDSIEIPRANLPESVNVKRIYLRSKEELDMAFSKGKQVLMEKVQVLDSEYTRFYVNVAINKLIEAAL